MREIWRVCGIAMAGAIVVASGGAAQPVGPELTPKLRDLLRQEMASVLVASQEILGAVVTGDHATIADRAQRIHDSFILEQSLSDQDRKDLMSAVPPEFVELDRAFHETSAELAAAARAGDVERELITFGEMTGACVACHARFAGDRFPALAEE
ncbi:MAG TPA: cytochrome c [Geminicoccaceae bacterium]